MQTKNELVMETIKTLLNCDTNLDTQVDTFVDTVCISMIEDPEWTLLVKCIVTGYNEWIDIVFNITLDEKGMPTNYYIMPFNTTSVEWAIYSDIGLIIKTVSETIENLKNKN